MKYVLLAIFVVFATQPLQVYSCPMHADQGAAHGQHGNMQDNDMQDMDCCDHDPAQPGDGCDFMSHCGTCVAVAVAIYPATIAVVFSTGSVQPVYHGNAPLQQFNSPPFRPPIA